MTPKDILTNKSFCPIPWTGFHIDPTGTVKNCICSFEPIGTIAHDDIKDILQGAVNTQIKQDIIADLKPSSCSYCYGLEKNKKTFNVVSSRIYYLKELKTVSSSVYDSAQNFSLHHADIRWSNTCNFACVYCGPVYSSKWAQELNVKVPEPSPEKLKTLRKFVFDNIPQLKNVYLAGGEPLLTKENESFLKELLASNPNVVLRVNTNLSKTNTKILDLICEFPNVHWTVSAESMGADFEYMRYGGKWTDFLSNLDKIKTLPHKLTFNMVWCILNYQKIFDTVDYFLDQGYHENSFILTAIFGPGWLDCRHLPKSVLDSVGNKLQDRIAGSGNYLLKDGYQNLFDHIQQPFEKNLSRSFEQLARIDQRRHLDSSKIFIELYQMREEN